MLRLGRTRGIALGLLAWCAAVACGGAARARAQAAAPASSQQAASSEAQYTELIRGALGEMSAQRYPEARALFMKAHALQPSARTERGLGLVEFEMRHYTLAAAHFRAALASNVRPLEAAMRGEVEQALARAESYTGSLQLSLTPASGVLELDGQPVSPESDGSLRLDLGEHELQYSAAGYQPQLQKLSIAGGEHAQLAFVLLPLTQPGPSGAVRADAAPSAADRSPSVFSRWWFWTAAGVVVASAVVGVAALTSSDKTEPPITGNLGKTQALLRVAP
jgi:hypothetical protein